MDDRTLSDATRCLGALGGTMGGTLGGTLGGSGGVCGGVARAARVGVPHGWTPAALLATGGAYGLACYQHARW